MSLLHRDAPARSERDPDLEESAIVIALHPATGTFADPTHESAFAVEFFRMSFPSHAFLLALVVAVILWPAFGSPFECLATWLPTLALVALGLVGRVLIHHMEDTVLAQRIGSWTWAAMAVVTVLFDMRNVVIDPAATCSAFASSLVNIASPLMFLLSALAFALINGSHGMGFLQKTALISLMLFESLIAVSLCSATVVLLASNSALLALVGFAVAHLAEMRQRHSYVEKVGLREDKRRLKERLDEEGRRQKRLDEEGRRLEERNEQLRAEKERLMYDVQRRGRPHDDGDDRSAIRRGLQAGASQPYQPADKTDSSGTGAPASSDSPPASLPPGPPSSSSGESSQVSRTSAAVTPAAQLLPRPASRHFEVDGLLDRRCAEMAAASTTEQAGASWARGTKRQAAAGEVAEFKAGAGKASAAKASAGRARAEQGLEQLLGWQVSSDPIYVNARARLAAAQVQTCNAGPSTPPPTSTELDAQHYARLAATSAAERGLVPTGGPSSTAGRSTVPPPSLAELAYRRHYKELALAESAMEQGVPPSTARPPPLTWRELHASAANQATEDELAAAQALSNMSQKRTS